MPIAETLARVTPCLSSRHNIMYSSMGGKNMTRFVMPHHATVFGPTIATKADSPEPTGAVYAALFMYAMQWNQTDDKLVTCQGSEILADLGVHTNFSCLSAVDLGVYYGYYKGTNYAVWRGDTDKHCHICNVSGNVSTWKFSSAKGAISYVWKYAQGEKLRKQFLNEFDVDGDQSMVHRP